jgi:predicted glycoside hydrolase/deacetylase ChbG (UPF0249 family)
LIVTADDYGLARAYDEGILEAVRADAVDAVSAMVLRDPEPGPLLESGVEVGLHLEPLSSASLDAQVKRFEELFGRVPAHIDGHHHCHAHGARWALAVARVGRRLRIRVRSVSARHRRLLRSLGVITNDHLVGRLREAEPALPAEVVCAAGNAPLPGITEWMTHPGRRDPHSRSGYDEGREEDLRLLLALAEDPSLRKQRNAVRRG